jgi:hypothetical protein
MYRLYRANGTEENLPDGELKTLQAAVGGYIEAHYVKTSGDLFYCNEEGRLTGLPINETATFWAGFPIVGDVVLLVPDRV